MKHKHILTYTSLFLLLSCQQVREKCTDFEVTDNFTRVKTENREELSEQVFWGKNAKIHRFFANKQDSLHANGAALYVPQNSLTRDRTLSITKLDSVELPSLPSNLKNVTAHGKGYRFLPHGNHFRIAAKVVLPFDSLLIPRGYTVDDIRTYYYNEENGRWIALARDTIKRHEQLASAYTTHFTDMINGILQVPESPQTQGYVPTTLSDIRTASPMTGVTQMGMPSANQNGTASLTYPFEVPTGRAGLQANVALQYSSDGASGYTGYGWNLSIASIDIETRWGVPHFDPAYESESYLMMGQQLNDRIYRNPEQIGRQSEKRFSPMVESAFSEIIRHGDGPKNYWWEVIEKTGTRSYYGLTAESRLVNDNGNIIKWALCKVIDIHGNFIAYHYRETGGNLYPERYTYTGFGETEGNYSVEFEIEEGGRSDVVQNGRLGILQVESALLQRVSIKNNGTLLRAYDMHYDTGVFGKTILVGIDQKDSKDNLVGTQTFDYYNDVEKGMFSAPVTYTSDADDYERVGLTKTKLFSDELSLLGAGYAKNNTVGGGIMVGAGWGPFTVNVGASYSYNKSKNEGRMALIDINGDGLPDKLWKGKDKKLYYRLNLNKDMSRPTFGETRKIEGVTSFSEGETESHQSNINTGTGFGLGSFGYAHGNTWDKSKTKIYLQDFNADGLVDIAKNGTVYFNHSDGETVTFSPSSGNTGNALIGASTEIDAAFIPDYAAIEDSLKEEFPLHDIVKLWRAPYSGTVEVTSTVDKLTAEGDGVNLSMQHNGGVLWQAFLQSGSVTVPLQTLNVEVGDYILFRVNANNSGLGDEVAWNPQIIYTQMNVNRYAGTDLTSYNSKQDYIVGEYSSVALDIDGSIPFGGTFSKGKTSDDVTLSIVKTMRSNDIYIQTPVYKRTFRAADEVSDIAISDNIESSIADSATINFVITTHSPIDWQQVDWRPTVAKDGVTYSYTPQRLMFNKNISLVRDSVYTMYLPQEITGENGLNEIDTIRGNKIAIVPSLSVSRTSEDDTDIATAYLTIKNDKGDLLYNKDLSIGTNNRISSDSIYIDDWNLINRLCSEKLQITYSIPNEIESVSESFLQIYRDTIVYSKNDTGGIVQDISVMTVGEIPVSVYSGFNRLDYGSLYKGWGQFAWNGNEGALVSIPIDEMRIPDVNTDEFIKDNVVDEEAFQASVPAINKQKFFSMLYQAEGDRYVSVTDGVYITSDNMRSSRLGTDEITVERIEYSQDGDGLPSPVLETKSNGKSNSYSGSLSIGGSLGVNKGHSEQDSYTIVSTMDLNGDGYPDWIKDNDGNVRAQLTRPTGKLGENINLDVDNSLFYGETENAGGSIGMPFDGPSGGFGLDNFKNSITKAKNAVAASRAGVSQSRRTNKDANDASAGGNTVSGSCSASGNFSNSISETERDWGDLNGDGLPDILDREGTVRYNLGNGFTEKRNSGIGKIGSSATFNFGEGLGVSVSVLGHFGISAGMNSTECATYGESTLGDMNGDGLPDLIERDKDGNLLVTLNTGNGFMPQQSLQGNSEISGNLASSLAVYGSVAYTISIPLPFGFRIDITPSVEASHSESFSRTTNVILDMNGDGLPDLVYSGDDMLSNNERSMRVCYNQTGRTNMLKSVTLPLGAKYEINYARTEPSFNMPGRRWVMSGVELTGGKAENGATRMKQTFEYKDGYRDRCERDFYGFKTITTHQLDTENNDAVYRTIVKEFANNKDYYRHNLMTSEKLFDGNGILLQQTIYDYDLIPQKQSEVRYPALKETQKTLYTGNVAQTTRERFEYDEIGNIVRYTSEAGDVVNVSIAYHKGIGNHRVPQKVTAEGGATRTRTSEVNNKGDITRLTLANGGKPSVYDMEYDAYGNITKLTKPMNANGERLWHAYTYDNVLHTLVTNVKDAYGYSSSAEYDYQWGVPVSTTDMNGNKITYTYDNTGRLSSVTAPLEQGRGTHSIDYAYHPAEGYALTTRHTPEGDICTYVCCDNMGRAVGERHTAEVYGRGKCLVMSGQPVYDAFGRTVKTSLPYIEGSRPAGYAETRYDALDRTTASILPDGEMTVFGYTVENNQLKTTVVDPAGHVSDTYTDLRGRTTQTTRHSTEGDVTVKYQFNPLGELLQVTHPNGHNTTYTYDGLGRKLSVNHPDAGLTEFTYDAAGNVLTKVTPNLRGMKGGAISYSYDHERLTEIQYPKNIFNRVQYTYGEPGAGGNRAGRLVLVQDASGGTEYSYDALGNVTRTIKTIMLTATDVRTYVSESAYDSWGRIRTMAYPDGEKVTYSYNAAGSINSITAVKDGKETPIVIAQGYDHLGNVVYRQNGNGTENRYIYDPLRRRLTDMQASTAGGGTFMKNAYLYDKIDNILSITNTARPGTGNIGGTFSHQYTYDDLSRLVSAQGTCKDTISYSLQMSYDIMSNPLSKIQTVQKSAVATSHDLAYRYEHEKPNAATQIGGAAYRYDANGNPTIITTDTTTREMLWDEENRLQQVNDDGYVSRYTYDHTGNRAVKSHGPLEAVYVNGAPQGINYHDEENYTVYVSPYMTVNAERFTKYYYNGNERVASKLGTGVFDNIYGVNNFHLTAGQKDYAERMVQIEESRHEYMKQLGTPPGVPTQKGQNAEPEITGTALPNAPMGNYDVPEGWPTAPRFNAPGDVPGPPLQWEEPEDISNPEAGYGYKTDEEEEKDIFFFHSDHLGSTAYVTDANGGFTQFVAYMPYGESFVDEHKTSFENPFKFNGKEQDEVTGLYYYGARYLDPFSGLFTNLDPLYEKFPAISGYTYCMANPVRLVDLDGCEPTEEEAARMAAHVYGDKSDNILIGGWKISEERIERVTYNEEKSGFKSQLYERTIDGVTEYCYVTAGTDFTSKEDWKNNFGQIVGASEQYSISMNNADIISKALNGKELTFAGHSLGGGLAAANAYSTGKNAITFNAAWVSPLTIGYFKRNDANIDAFVNFFDELKMFQGSFGMYANGNMHIQFNRSSLMGHSIDNFYKKGFWDSAKDYVSGKMSEIKCYLNNLWPNPSMMH